MLVGEEVRRPPQCSFSQLTNALACCLGKTVCLGQRLAKLEMKLLSAMFLLGIDFSVVDNGGRVLETLPRPNWNDILGCKPPKDSCFIQYRANYGTT